MLKHDPMIEHNESYRSIHYTIYIDEKDMRDARLEIQTRTIFEEGWSEINHKLVYKSKDIGDYFLLSEASKILSAIVGDSDNIGELMRSIHSNYLEKQRESEKTISNINAKTDSIMKEVLEQFLRD
jgi:ppGpp synthetase/RelA/SpoT-type nucleotidyltranferase